METAFHSQASDRRMPAQITFKAMNSCKSEGKGRIRHTNRNRIKVHEDRIIQGLLKVTRILYRWRNTSNREMAPIYKLKML